MLYIVWAVIIAIAVVLGLFTVVWGGILWIVAAGIVLTVVLMGRARETKVERARTEPSGTPRASHGGAETANKRVQT